MKGFSEQRGVQSRTAFDADKGQFMQQQEVHDFVAAIRPRVSEPPDGTVIELAARGSGVKVSPRLRKNRADATAPLKMTRAG